MDCYNHLQNRLTTLSNDYRLNAYNDSNNNHSKNSNTNNHNAIINNFDNDKKFNNDNFNNNVHIEHIYNDSEYNISLKSRDCCANSLRTFGKNLNAMCNSVSCSEINYDNNTSTT